MYTEMADANASKLVTKNDPRVTRVGRIIRKTSLDELPQLFNVVFEGNLSLVGPRPHAVNAQAAERLYDEAVDGYFARHRVKPGITGWDRSMAGVARPIPPKNSKPAWSTTFSTSKTGLCCFDLPHSRAHAFCPAIRRECLLIRSSDVDFLDAPQRVRSATPATITLLHGALFLAILVSPLVFIEPSPYEAACALLALTCIAAGIRLDRKLLPLVALLLIFNVGGC